MEIGPTLYSLEVKIPPITASQEVQQDEPDADSAGGLRQGVLET